jgi:hypothetical protein
MNSRNAEKQVLRTPALAEQTASSSSGWSQKVGRLLLPALLATGCAPQTSTTAELHKDTYTVYTEAGATITQEVPEIIVGLRCKADEPRDDILRVQVSYIRKLHASFPTELDRGILDVRPIQLDGLDTSYVASLEHCPGPFPAIP